MSRPLRLHIPGMLYHVFARGNEKACIFTDADDYRRFLDLLASALARFGVACLSFCALSNHYHLLLAAGSHPISRLMQQLNSTYCARFNRRHRRVGHLLQGRFGARIVDDGLYTRAVLRYVALNAVAAGLVNDPLDWPWSSYRYTVGPDPCPDFLDLDRVWQAFGTTDPAVGRARFAEFVRGGVQDLENARVFLGSAALADRLAPRLAPHKATRDFVYGERVATRPVLGTLFDGVLSQCELEQIAHRAFYEYAYTLSDIGTLVRRDPSTVWRWIRRAGARLEGIDRSGREVPPSSREDDRERIKI